MLNVTMCAQLRSATLLIVITDAFKLIKKNFHMSEIYSSQRILPKVFRGIPLNTNQC